jgi:hypothetical protein
VRGEPGRRDPRFLFFDQDLHQLENRPLPDYAFDPRERPWFVQGLHSEAVVATAPYLFFTTREVGTTFARRSADGQAVAAVDVTLAAMSDLLRGLRPTPSAELAIVNDRGEIVADADSKGALPIDQNGQPRLARVGELGRPVLESLAGSRPQAGYRVFPLELAGGTWQGLISIISQAGAPLYLVAAAPHSELLAQADRIRDQSLLLALAALVVSIPITIFLSRLASRPLAALTREAATIRAFKFDRPLTVRSFITEIDALARTMGTMKSTIQRFLGIGAVLAGERRFDRLLDRILVEMIRVASARGGIIYLAEPEGGFKCALARWDDQVIEQGPPDLDAARDRDHPVIRATAEGALLV